jgi:hypothetical protein
MCADWGFPGREVRSFDSSSSVFIWREESHLVQLAYIDWLPEGDERRFVGWFDENIGYGVMREDQRLTFDELVEHWRSEMRRRGN